MFICGCKLSNDAPFCDGVTCQQILKGEVFELKEDMLYLNENEDEDEEEEGAAEEMVHEDITHQKE